MLNVPLHFENGLTIDALVDSAAYFRASRQNELNRIEQQAPQSLQNRRSSHFSNSSSNWPVRETNGNNSSLV